MQIKRLFCLIMVFCMIFGMFPNMGYASSNSAVTSLASSGSSSGSGATVTQAVYQTVAGFVYSDATVIDNGNGTSTIKVGILTQGKKMTVSTEPVISSNVNVVKANLVKGNLVDYEAANGAEDTAIIPSDAAKTFNKVLAKGSGNPPPTQFDTMKYGPELSSKDGVAGNMVAAGWVYDKTSNTITVGDGRVVTEDISGRALAQPVKRYEETYNVASDVKVYNVNTSDYSLSEVSDFASIPVTADYKYTTTSRQAVYVVFDKNYKEADTAKVTAIYYFTPPSTSDDKPVWDVPTQSFLLKDKGTDPESGNTYESISATGVSAAPYTRSTEPFEIVKDTFYWVGDNEVAVYLFNADMGTADKSDDRLIMLDAGWPNSGYQYWKNIEAMGYDPRKVTDIMLTHGHSDHYGTAVELINMIENAGGSVKLWGSKEDTFGITQDAMGNAWNISGALPASQTVIRSKTVPYEYDKDYDFGNVKILVTPTPGHTVGTASFIFKTKNPANGEWVNFGYMGGYGFNGLEKPKDTNGYLRLNFQLGLAWLQQVVDVDFVSPQHTNQYPMVEAYQALKAYNNDPANAGKQLTLLDALTKNEFINFCEKRYQVATNAISDDAYGDGRYQSIENYGPFKPGRENGLTGVKATLLDSGKIIQGFNSYQNVNPAIPLLKDGVKIDKDSYVHDPDGWYVQFYIDVLDNYAGYLPGKGPVESLRPTAGAPEILRTQRLNSRAEAEAILATVQKGGTYTIDLTKASAIVVPSEITKTFTPADSKTTIDHTTYGWALSNATKNSDGTVSVKIKEVPNFEEKTYTTAISLADDEHLNTVTGVTRADALANGDLLKKDAFVEIQFNAAGQCINMEVIEFSDVTYMDSASYGGELTAKGGGAGNMVATGWILDKDQTNKTITIGDGNHVTNVFEEKYTLADDCKIYEVNNSTTDGTKTVNGISSVANNVPGDWNLVKEGNFSDITVTAKGSDGEIYYTPERYTAVCVFDSNYKTSWKDGSAKVKELYLFKNPLVLFQDPIVLNKKDLATPDGMQYDGTSWYPAKSKLEEKTWFSYNGSCEPIEIMKNRLYDVGDAYTDIYLFVGDDGKLSLLDQGNRNASYQYWLNIEKVGYDPRDVDNILLTHGHGDHYQALYENCLMIKRAGGNVNALINSYSQGATINSGNVEYKLDATLTDKPVLYSISGIIEWDKWLDFAGSGISVYPWRSIGHTNDTGSFVFKVKAKDGDAYFKPGDTVSWVYYGGYGARTSMSQGANRLQIIYTMMYEQSVITPWAQAQSDYVYPLAQHTNQYPQHEIYKAAKIAGIPYAKALTEGAEGISNFMEKRISVGFYEWMDKAYRNKTDAFGNMIESKAGFRADSSGATFFDTVQAHGPFKRPDGEYTVNVKAVNVVHGYDAFQNKNDAFKGQTNIYGFDLGEGFVIDKDSYTHDPDGWYVQVICKVDDGYNGGVDYDTNFYKGNYTSGANDAAYDAPGKNKTWPGGPVEMATNPNNWVEILRTERFDSKEKAEAYAKALTNNGYTTPYETYGVDGSKLYSYNGTQNEANPITEVSASNTATYKVNLSKASEILLGSSFENTFKDAEDTTNGVAKLHGISKVFTAYHQLAAVAVEYDSNVTAPVFDPSNPAYTIRDYAGPYMREEYDRAPNGEYSEAKIAAIYTNSEPTMREDKTSVPGKYVIVELAEIKEIEPYSGDQGYRPLNDAVLATWRQLSTVINRDDTCERWRKDYSDVVITQNVDVKDAANTATISPAGKLPELKYENLKNLEVDEFVQSSITTKVKGSKAQFSYYLPKGYDPSNKTKKYPMVVYVTGNSGRLEFRDGAVLGDEPENIGGNITRDRMALRWLNEDEDVIVVAPQTSRLNVPYDYDVQDEISSVIEYFKENYNVDTGRVYAIGSSIGTQQLNTYLKTNASKIAGFVSNNGFAFTGVKNIFKAPYSDKLVGKSKAEVLAWGSETRVDDATYASILATAKEAFKEVTTNRVPMWYYMAVNDNEIAVSQTLTNYYVLRDLYKQEGLSEEEINKLVKLTLYDDSEMLSEGIVEFHGAVKKAAADPDLGKNLLALKQVLATKPIPSEVPTINKDDWYKTRLSGFYEDKITLSDTDGAEKRTFNMYVPEGTAPNQAVVHILVPSYYDAAQFLRDSGWKKIADEELVTLMLYSANGDSWGDYSTESVYLNRVYTFLSKRPYINVRKHNMYMAAYGDAADIGAQFAMKNPQNFAGILAVGTNGISDDMVSAMNNTNSSFFNPDGNVIKLGNIIYPAWLVAEEKTDSVSRMINYFKTSNRTFANASQTTLADEYYASDASRFTGDLENEAVAGVYYTKGKTAEAINYTFSLKVWKNMFESMRRYPSFGEIRSYIPSDEDKNFKKYEATVDGYSRFWYVYTPDSAKGKTNVPVVFVFHGAGGGPTEITDQTGWKITADKLGVILVAPQASATWDAKLSTFGGLNYATYTSLWSTAETATNPNDYRFVDYLYKWLTVDSDYAGVVDASRFFSTGQSYGSFFTHKMVQNRPKYFAAAAGACFINTEAPADVSVDIPVMSLMGQKDTTIRGGFSKDAPKNFGDPKDLFETYINRYGLTEKGDLDRTYDDFTFMDANPVCTEKDGMLNKYIFDTAKGYPMFVGVETVGKGHATIPTECNYIWEEMFSHYSRDPQTGILYYDGNVVDTPKNLALDATKELPKVSDLKIDRNNYYGVFLEGYYNTPVTLNDKVTSRPLKMYVPKDSTYNQATVFVAVPNGTDPYVFLVKSGWKAVSDQKHITIALMQPDTGKVWGSYEEEKEYLDCAYAYISKRPFISTNVYCMYIAGYGDAADLVEKYAMNTPDIWAGVLSVGSTGLTEADAATLASTKSKIDGIMRNEVPVPSWIVSSEKTANVDRLVNYWKSANQTVADSTAVNYADAYYAPDKNADVGQPNSEAVAGVYYSTKALSDCLNDQFALNVWNNMFSGVRRYVGLANWHLREYKDIYELGYEKYNAMVDGGTYTDSTTGETMSSGEFNREWYVYVPDSVKKKSGKSPVIFVFPGRSGTGDEIASRMGWDRTAEENGAIVVSLSPSIGISNENYNGLPVNAWRTLWTTAAKKDTPNDLLYFDYVRNWLLNNAEYKDIVDASRIYATGQSMGGMFTHAVAAARPGSIAAAGACSWVAFPGDSMLGANNIDEDYDVALMVMMGQKDTTIPGGFSKDSGMTNGKGMFDYYINRYGVIDTKGRNNWTQFTFMVNDPTCSYKNGIYNNYDFKTTSRYTMFRGVEVVGMQHATMPEETYMMWNDMFSHYSRDPQTGILYYDGNAVDTPKNLELFHKQYGSSHGSSSGGSSSGGSSSSGTTTDTGSTTSNTSTSSNTPVITASKPAVTNKGEAKVTVESKSISDALSKAKTDESGIKTISVEVPKADGAVSYTSVIPAAVVTAADVSQKIEIKTELGSVQVPGNMLGNSGLSGAKEVGINIGTSDKANLSEDVKAKIGDRPVIELSVNADGKNIEYNNPDAPVTVSVPYTPTAEELKNPENIVVWYIDGAGKAVTVPNGRYDAATGKVVFTTTHFSKYAVAYVVKSFNDIASYSWAKKQIEVLAAKGVINGTTENTFSPELNIKRADFMLLLVKTLNLSANVDSNFSDVAKTDYYYEAVGIAKKLGITEGSGNNIFNPQENITRQDMMVLVARALKKAGKLKAAGTAADIKAYSDASDVADYAADSVASLVNEKLIQGSNNTINPNGTATRAEIAVLMYRIYNK